MADNAQSILRRLRDISDNPRLYLEMLADRLANFNKGRVAEIRPEGAGYRKLTPKERTEQMVGGALDNIGGGGLGALGIIKGKGGNWLSNSVENALRGLKRTDTSPEMLRILESVQNAASPEFAGGAQQQINRRLQENASNAVLNKWIEGPLTKYVKRDMATEGDPVRRLAEQGILHIPEQATVPSANARFLRSLHYSSQTPKGTPFEQWEAGAKQAQEGVAKSDLAKQWEDISDSTLDAESISSYLNPDTYFHTRQEPWMQTADPESSVFRVRGSRQDLNRPDYVAGDLGFQHLTDELANALNPESGLPRNLLLTPEQMQQMGMEKAVRHVADINAWRAAQKAAADLARAQNPATVLFKEYAENNPKGLRWVELKARETPKQERDWAPDIEFDKARQELQDALKYEGDIMGHCVGKYCPDVMEGRSRIFSLRDTKGQPHVTIETRPGRDPSGLLKEDQLPPDVLADLKKRGLTDPKFMWRFDEDLGRHVPEMGPFVDSIIQIKGKGNRAPIEEYLPFVQDFVKSGKWSDVGDLQNTGLRRVETTEGVQYFTPEEFEAAKDALIKPGYARGGLVEANNDFAYPGMF